VQPLLIASDFGRQQLDCDLPIKLRVAREIHFAHPAFANLRADFVAAECCAWSETHRFKAVTQR
jgi:hypothetical protein